MILNLKIDKYNKTTLKIILDNGILICILYRVVTIFILINAI